MAKSFSALDDALLKKMEGLISEVNSNATPLPPDPYHWVMQKAKSTLVVVQRWAKGHVSNGAQPKAGVTARRHEDFVRLFDELQALSTIEPMGVIVDVMRNADNNVPAKTRLAAAAMVKAAVWPARYGPHATRVQVEVSAESSGESSASDESQEVWDELTEDESTELDALLTERDARQSAVDAFVKTIRGRVAAKSSGY